ncbi:MAG: hypothetical protein ABS81_00655 [Pseudonocardia sp. SCN 72-86]|nr:MAG: hypothetical protein ABS81_00655 [Pseudonocardia sp. SCN 72-86]
MTTSRAPFSEASLRAWLAVAAPQVELGASPLRMDRLSGGRSNLTYRVQGCGAVLVLRHPPTGGVLQSAHDMAREWTFITAMSTTKVPVAGPVARDRADEFLGVDCYLTEYVAGSVLHTVAQASSLSPEARRRVGPAMIEVLAELHRLDPDEIGLSSLRRPGRHLDRQLRRWRRQVAQSSLPDTSRIEAVAERLQRSRPDNPDGAVCHGDYRPGNVSVAPSGEVLAVFDWELATLGDPLTDLGYLLASWPRPRDPHASIGGGPTLAEGFAERADLVDLYTRLSGRDLSTLPFYTAFARWRAACIGAGVYTRYASGVMGSVDDTERLLRERLVLMDGLLDGATADLDRLT